MAPRQLKRFYEVAAAVKAEGGYQILLDGKPVRTPGGRTVLLPGRALAEALAAEWDAQRPFIDLPRMGLHQLVCNTLDRGAAGQQELLDELVAYGETELLCYRAGEPAALAARQAAAWDPLLDWAANRFGARLGVTSGIMAITQDAAAISALRDRIARADPFQLTALRAATGIGGSLIVALALAEAHLDLDAAWRMVNVDEDWQREKWGEDTQAAANRADALLAFTYAARMLQLLETDRH